MKRVLILALLLFAATTAGYSQKADKAAAAQAQLRLRCYLPVIL